MNKLGKLDIVWFEKEDRRKAWKAALHKNGKLYLGKSLCSALPPDISVGFDKKKKLLVIADGTGAGVLQPNSGILEFRGLVAEIVRLGFHLPVKFKFSLDDVSGLWLGRILPPKQDADYAEQLLIIYQHIVDQLVRIYAKTTPLKERHAIATEALCAAVAEYRPWHGDMENYLYEYVKRHLLMENKHFTAVARYEYASLDAPFSAQEDSAFCPYDVIADSTPGGIVDIEEKIALEQFFHHLSQQECVIVSMAREGFSVAQIAGKLNLTQKEILDLGTEIGRKREAFYEAA